MVSTRNIPPSTHPLADIIERLESGGALLPDSPENVMEVVGILKSYGVVLDAYWRNLIYISEHQFLVLFPFFKYFNGEISLGKLLRHWWHDRINYEFAEYCMKAMFWHGGGKLDAYLDTPEFCDRAQQAIQAKLRGNLMMQGLAKTFPGFLPEQVRQMVYYSALGQFWRVMSPMFLTLSDRYDRGEIKTIPDVVNHVLQGLVAAADKPITYAVNIRGQEYEIIPKSAGLTFLMDTAVPYVEAVFFRSFPFMGTVSYNAQARQIPPEQELFPYGALYADPLPVGGAGIPPTLLMQDMTHFLPDYLHTFYQRPPRGENDQRVKICVSFQKAMFCVTTAAILGLMPFPASTADPEQQQKNRAYLESWMNRLLESRLLSVQVCEV
ncbi:CO2 hydration protein [Leptothermofonsia sichuanensis E412]|uniref:CO2 hydration protein n=1 Tax=Leptothermofonsia sichuanensis TaxID=2917832 RepID=UPI001CA76088|nr:CO2 hydration protein [Leptothermofonsia sichuanensis]QZZ22963.1 CO2 hydration protein [Leptothermofonsia sichuanensis E412]